MNRRSFFSSLCGLVASAYVLPVPIRPNPMIPIQPISIIQMRPGMIVILPRGWDISTRDLRNQLDRHSQSLNDSVVQQRRELNADGVSFDWIG